MTLMIKQEASSNFEKPPVGMHVARCCMVCDLGIQTHEYNGEEKSLHKVRIAFELCTELQNEGEYKGLPFVVAQNYTASFHAKATLKKDLESWRGRPFTDEELQGFDLHSVVGAPCLINVVHNDSNGKVYANIAAINPMMKGVDAPQLVTPVTKFSLAEYTNEEFEALPKWLQEKVNTEIPNYEALNKIQDANKNEFIKAAAQGMQAPQDVQGIQGSAPPAGFDIGDDIPF